MRRLLLVAGAAITLVVASARSGWAQPVVSDSIRASAQRAAGNVLVVEALLDENGTLTLQLEADELSFDRIRRQSWPSGLYAPARRSTAQVGREIARAAVAASAQSPGIRSVEIIVRSTNPQDDPSRVRMTYARSELFPRTSLEPS